MVAATNDIFTGIRQVAFFTVQAFGFYIEYWLGLDKLPRVLGHAWVVAWLSLTGPIFLNEFIKNGLLDGHFINLGIGSRLLNVVSQLA